MRLVQMVVLVALALVPSLARADMEAAKVRHKKGMSYYALGKFAEAATEYEAAFELEPDAAFLYNAAQAHRLAGHRVRALALYQSFVRTFPDHANAPGAERQVAALRTAIDADRQKGGDGDGHPANASAAVKAPPLAPSVNGAGAASAGNAATATGGVTLTPAAATSTTSAPPASAALTETAPQPAKKKTPRWVWGVVAGVAAVAAVGVGVGLGVGLSGDRYPSPTVGSARLP